MHKMRRLDKKASFENKIKNYYTAIGELEGENLEEHINLFKPLNNGEESWFNSYKAFTPNYLSIENETHFVRPKTTSSWNNEPIRDWYIESMLSNIEEEEISFRRSAVITPSYRDFRFNQSYLDAVTLSEYYRHNSGSSLDGVIASYQVSPNVREEIPFTYIPNLDESNLLKYLTKYEGRYLILLEKGGPAYV